MPLLEVQQIKTLPATIHIEESIATTVDQYAAFIRGTADDVINRALEYVFAKDKDFQKFLSSDASRSPVPASLRIRPRADGKAQKSPTVQHPRAVKA